MVGDNKIAGVLAEAAFDDEGVPWVVIGIGLNCLQSQSELSGLGRGATSIFAETGTVLDLVGRISLSMDIVSRFSELYLPLDDPLKRIEVASLYKQACETIGLLVRVETVGETLVGVASDISEDGNLLVEADSRMRVVSAGDVIHLRKTS